MSRIKENTINLHLISKGNQLEFGRLVSHYSNELLNFAKGYTGQKEMAEEIVGDVFIKLWEKRKNLSSVKNLKSYLFIAVKNACYTASNKKSNEIFFNELSEFHLDKIAVPESQQIESDLMDMINNAIEKLPPKCKLVFSMAKIQGFNHKEIAQIVGISEKTVEYHTAKAVKKILDIIKNKSSS